MLLAKLLDQQFVELVVARDIFIMYSHLPAHIALPLPTLPPKSTPPPLMHAIVYPPTNGLNHLLPACYAIPLQATSLHQQVPVSTVISSPTHRNSEIIKDTPTLPASASRNITGLPTLAHVDVPLST